MKNSNDKNLKTFTIKIDNDKIKKSLFDYRHFENVYLLFLQRYENDMNIILDYGIMRSVINNTNGGKNSEKIQIYREKYKNDDLLITLKNIFIDKKLRIHNICNIIKRIKGQYKAYFTNIKNDKKAYKPKPKKLKLVTDYSLNIDISFWSIRRKNIISVNLFGEQIQLHIKHEPLLKIVKNLKNINSINVKYSQNELYLHISYIYEKTNIKYDNYKEAGFDLGINNTCAIFINDDKSDSLIYDGKQFKKYNSDFNRILSKLNTSISENVVEYVEIKDKKYPSKYNNRGEYLRNFKKFLYEKRHRYFENEFNKLSRRVVEYLLLNNVTNLVISYNLAELKYNGKCKLNKAAKQNFIQIPIIKFLRYVENKCNEVGIIVNTINESNTSRCSCISDDVNQPANVLNGKRVKRGLFEDTKIKKVYNADLGGSVNHIKKFNKQSFEWIQFNLKKVCNPVKISSDHEFCKYLQNSKSDKE